MSGALFEPDFDAFGAEYDAGRPQLVVTRLVADLETPVSGLSEAHARSARRRLSARIRRRRRRARPLLDDRPRPGRDLARPSATEREINRDALADANAFDAMRGAAARRLRAAHRRIRASPQAGALPPMAAGVFGYLGYDMVRQMERLAPAKPDPIGVPDALLMRPTVMVVFDSVRDEISIVTPVRPQAGVAAQRPMKRALARLDASRRDAGRPAGASRRAPPTRSCSLRTPRLEHAAVALSRDGRARQGIHPRRRHLSGRAVAAFHGAVRTCRPSRSIARCAASIPRRSCAISISATSRSSARARKSWCASRDGKVTIRPIAGTRWRGDDAGRGRGAGGRTARRSRRSAPSI